MQRGVLTVFTLGVACAGGAPSRSERRDGLIVGCRCHLRSAASSVLQRQQGGVAQGCSSRTGGRQQAHLPAWHEPGRAPTNKAMASCCGGHAITAQPES